MQILLPPSSPGGMLGKIVTPVLTAVLAVLALTLSAVLVGVVLVVGVFAWAYLWWRTRTLRKQMQAHAPRTERTRAYDIDRESARGGVVVEGEVTRVEVS